MNTSIQMKRLLDVTKVVDIARNTTDFGRTHFCDLTPEQLAELSNRASVTPSVTAEEMLRSLDPLGR